jgi:hypothetical protein
MTAAFDETIREVLAKLEQQRENLVRLHQNMDEVKGSARSSRRQVSAVVDARGELLELKFHGQTYKSLEPAELSKLIMDTIADAHAKARSSLFDSIGDTMPEGVEMAQATSGEHDWSAELSNAMTLPDWMLGMLRSAPKTPMEHPQFSEIFAAFANEATMPPNNKDAGGASS